MCEKKWHRVQKKWALEKKPFRKKFIFFLDKLNMINFNIFACLNSYLLVNLVLSLLRNRFENVSFNSTLPFLLVFYFDCLFEDWSVVCLLYFVLSLLDILFILFPEVIVRLIFWGIVKPHIHDSSERLEIIMNIDYHLSWILWCFDLVQHCV